MPPKGISTGRVIKQSRIKNKTPLRTSSRKTRSQSQTTQQQAQAASTTTTTMPSSSTQDEKASGPVYFWKPEQGHGYLGQWYPTPFTYKGDTYATAEMWMMVQKARLFGDEDIAGEMLATMDPKRHKALGRQVRGFGQEVWDTNKLRIVEEGNYHKFTIAEDADRMRDMLLGTGDRELVEASPLDKIWGIGFGARNAPQNRKRWGKNLLGVALMNVRERLRKEGEGNSEAQVDGEKKDGE